MNNLFEWIKSWILDWMVFFSIIQHSVEFSISIVQGYSQTISISIAQGYILLTTLHLVQNFNIVPLLDILLCELLLSESSSQVRKLENINVVLWDWSTLHVVWPFPTWIAGKRGRPCDYFVFVFWWWWLVMALDKMGGYYDVCWSRKQGPPMWPPPSPTLTWPSSCGILSLKRQTNRSTPSLLKYHAKHGLYCFQIFFLSNTQSIKIKWPRHAFLLLNQYNLQQIMFFCAISGIIYTNIAKIANGQ